MNAKTTVIIAATTLMIAIAPIALDQAFAKSLTTTSCTKTKGGGSGTTSGECQGNRESSPTFQECTTKHAGNSENSKVKSSSCT